MDKVEKATEAIAEKRKLPEEIKARLNDYTFMNLIISIALMIYMIVINIIYLNEDAQFFSTSIKVFSIWLAIIDVLIFEIVYRKDSDREQVPYALNPLREPSAVQDGRIAKENYIP